MFYFHCRLIVEDGTGEGHVYVSDHLVPGAMGIPACDWSDLCDLVQQVGQVTYNKPLTSLHQVCMCANCGELSVLITYVISCTYHFLYHCFHKCCVMCAFGQLLLLLWYDNLLLGVLYKLQACDITLINTERYASTYTDGFRFHCC